MTALCFLNDDRVKEEYDDEKKRQMVINKLKNSMLDSFLFIKEIYSIIFKSYLLIYVALTYSTVVHKVLLTWNSIMVAYELYSNYTEYWVYIKKSIPRIIFTPFIMALNVGSHILFYISLALVIKFIAVIVAFVAYWILMISTWIAMAPQDLMFQSKSVLDKKPTSGFAMASGLMMYPSSMTSLFHRPSKQWAILRFLPLLYWIGGLIFLIITYENNDDYTEVFKWAVIINCIGFTLNLFMLVLTTVEAYCCKKRLYKTEWDEEEERKERPKKVESTPQEPERSGVDQSSDNIA